MESISATAFHAKAEGAGNLSPPSALTSGTRMKYAGTARIAPAKTPKNCEMNCFRGLAPTMCPTLRLPTVSLQLHAAPAVTPAVIKLAVTLPGASAPNSN